MDTLTANKPKKLKLEGYIDFMNNENIAPSIEKFDNEGDDHIFTGIDTPIRKDAFEKSDDQKIIEIEHHFRSIMEIMGLDLNDDSLRGTPHRVAKMYIKEIFSGLNPANKPDIKLFDNKYQYNEMLVEKNITFYSGFDSFGFFSGIDGYFRINAGGKIFFHSIHYALGSVVWHDIVFCINE